MAEDLSSETRRVRAAHVQVRTQQTIFILSVLTIQTSPDPPQTRGVLHRRLGGHLWSGALHVAARGDRLAFLSGLDDSDCHPRTADNRNGLR